MAEFEDRTRVQASADAVFGYVSDPAHLTEYVPDMTAAERRGGDLRVAAEVEGRHEEGSASFRPDPDRRRIEWASADGSGYRGWLAIDGRDGSADVTIHLSTHIDADADLIRSSLRTALGNIRSRVEAR